MMKNVRGTNSIDTPGMLYAWMLNMGDRAPASGSTQMTTQYNNRVGAGRTEMRYISAPGMDSPWYWYNWETCVGQNQIVTLNINGGSTISSDIDAIRATAWWYDSGFHSGETMDNINLDLRRVDNTPIIASTNAYDNKERVYSGSVGGLAVKLELIGVSITSDDSGCGTNSVRVWVTALLEDNDRDDGDGPTWNATTMVGVRPL